MNGIIANYYSQDDLIMKICDLNSQENMVYPEYYQCKY